MDPGIGRHAGQVWGQWGGTRTRTGWSGTGDLGVVAQAPDWDLARGGPTATKWPHWEVVVALHRPLSPAPGAVSGGSACAQGECFKGSACAQAVAAGEPWEGRVCELFPISHSWPTLSHFSKFFPTQVRWTSA